MSLRPDRIPLLDYKSDHAWYPPQIGLETRDTTWGRRPGQECWDTWDHSRWEHAHRSWIWPPRCPKKPVTFGQLANVCWCHIRKGHLCLKNQTSGTHLKNEELETLLVELCWRRLTTTYLSSHSGQYWQFLARNKNPDFIWAQKSWFLEFWRHFWWCFFQILAPNFSHIKFFCFEKGTKIKIFELQNWWKFIFAPNVLWIFYAVKQKNWTVF